MLSSRSGFLDGVGWQNWHDAPGIRALLEKSGFADVDLTPVDGGTRIRWAFRFEPKIPGTGAFMRFYLGRIVGGLARRLEAAGEPAG